MGKVNIGRVLLGGIVAGIVGNILGYLVDGLMLAPQWAAAIIESVAAALAGAALYKEGASSARSMAARA